MKYLPMLFLFILACTSSKKNEIKLLKDEVIAIHDEVMPKMGELRRARKSLMLQADTIMGSDSTRAMMLKGLADDLGNANEGMMQWMRNYEPEFDGTDEEVMSYLGDQKKSIQQVKEDMLESLKKGEEAMK